MNGDTLSDDLVLGDGVRGIRPPASCVEKTDRLRIGVVIVAAAIVLIVLPIEWDNLFPVK